MLRTLVLAGAMLLALIVPAKSQDGIASWYGAETCRNKRRCVTANGEHFPTAEATAAHRTFRFGTLVRVTVARTGRNCVVRINDRGPFISGRVIDLSPAAAAACGVSGLARVHISPVK